ncbi:hypothetical protein [Shimia marina]|uniref:Uncharacterized protein n=1 Tax=Shimia marina TaxID=321267 RepID=A0A0P1EUA0_9RHOB|nr:hypothetical protein [Shimia marina]CUH53901.1 hypothetical protein SHM7688_03370 [Shimia marina]SFE19845.1 hypothetical protein SAMN04488037_106140 [Shimia marina]
MTANQLSLLLLPVLICSFAVWRFVRMRNRKKNLPIKVHGPHRPDAGYDAKEIARSKGKGNGMADGGVG